MAQGVVENPWTEIRADANHVAVRHIIRVRPSPFLAADMSFWNIVYAILHWLLTV
jgi:hypothetical protein